MEIFHVFLENVEVFVFEYDESAGNRSQMSSRSVSDLCDALARVSALPEQKKKTLKFTGNKAPSSLRVRGQHPVTLLVLELLDFTVATFLIKHTSRSKLVRLHF